MVAPRIPITTVTFVDDYCAYYQDLFPEVRNFESFKYLHVGLISEIKRKSLPANAKVLGLDNEQPLHHFLTTSLGDTELGKRRLSLTLTRLKQRNLLIIDETGDKKKGDSTDYVTRQYIGNLGKVENSMFSVNAYGVLVTIVFPLTFKVFKPTATLQPEDTYKTKPQLATEIISSLKQIGFQFYIVLADCLYEESKSFRTALNKLQLKYVVAVHSNHQSWSQQEQITYGNWQFKRLLSNGKEQTRYIQKILFQAEEDVRSCKLTNDILRERKNNTWYLMTNLSGEIQETVGNTYGFRNWIEYGIKQAKNELGWADFRATDYQQIERWWSVVCCAYLMVSWHVARNVESPADVETQDEYSQSTKEPADYSQHNWWHFSGGWKSTLNNLRLIIQPYVFFNLIKPWLLIFDIPSLKAGFL